MENISYWNKETETMPRGRLQNLQLERFRNQMQYVYERSPFYRRKYDRAGIKPSDIKTLSDIERVPLTTKEELRESQAQDPPWGDFLCISPQDGVRVFQTTGTTGVPVKIILNKYDWEEQFQEQFMHHMHGYGIKTDDILFVPFGYGLHMAFWGFHSAMERAGVMVIPGGGQSTQERVKNIFEWNATVVCGTPTYMLYLGEAARKMGNPLSESAVRIVVLGGEPGANVQSTRRAIEELWGAICFDDLGSTELYNFGFDCVAKKGTHIIETLYYVECLDPETLKPVPPGEIGEMVISNLCTKSMPLLRYRLKDLVRFDQNACECGRTFLRLDGGVLGRSDDMIHFAGVNIFPSAMENLVRQVPEFSKEYQLVIPRMGSGKRLKIRVEPAGPHISSENMDHAVRKFVQNVKHRITLTPEVEIVETGKLPRFELKAKRVIREE